MPLSEIVNVVVTRETQAVSQASFGTLLILGTHKAFNERVRTYSSIQEVGVDFSSSSLEYIAAQDMFSQTVSPNIVKIGRRAVDDVDISVITSLSGKSYTVTINNIPTTISTSTSVQESTVVLDADLVTSNSIAVTVNGTPLAPIVFTTDHDTTMGLIAAAIEAEPGIVSALISDPNNRTITVTSEPNLPGIVNSFVVTLGASQATATITNNPQPTTIETIADALVTAINANVGINTIIQATDNLDGTFTISPVVSGTPYTINASTNLNDSNYYRVVITQAKPGQYYTVEVAGVSFTYQTTSSIQTNEDIAAALTTLINADATLSAVATDNLDGSFDIELNNGNTFSLLILPPEYMSIQKGLLIETLTPTDPIVDDLDAVEDEDSDWYGLAITDRTPATVLSAAGWAEARIKLFGTASDDPNIIDQAAGTDITSIAYLLNNAGYVRTFLLYHQDALDDFPECAWFGAVLPLTPGSETWAFKQLQTIPYSDLTTTQSLNARNKKANTYEYIGGVGITRSGTVSQGEYIDVIRGIDWLTARIQQYVYSTLVNNPKVPYTDRGITAIESQVRRALTEAVDNNFIADSPPYTVTVPKAANVPSVDKANRILRNVKFVATLAGAIHIVDITGTVSL